MTPSPAPIALRKASIATCAEAADLARRALDALAGPDVRMGDALSGAQQDEVMLQSPSTRIVLQPAKVFGVAAVRIERLDHWLVRLASAPTEVDGLVLPVEAVVPAGLDGPAAARLLLSTAVPLLTAAADPARAPTRGASQDLMRLLRGEAARAVSAAPAAIGAVQAVAVGPGPLGPAKVELLDDLNAVIGLDDAAGERLAGATQAFCAVADAANRVSLLSPRFGWHADADPVETMRAIVAARP